MIDIENITIKEARAIAALFASNHPDTSGCRYLPGVLSAEPWVVGGKYFIRTVTHHYTGKLRAVYAQELVLTDAAWIADDGRLADALKTGEFNEVEPYPDGDVIIGRGAILDACVIATTPRSQK